VTELKRPPNSEAEETLRGDRGEQPLEIARADALPESSRPGEDRSADPRRENDKQASRPEPKQTSAPRVEGTYRIQTGDDLDLVFVEQWAKGMEYRLLPGDEIRVEFILGSDVGGTQRSPLDRTVRLQPDGMISLPYIGVVSASGMSVRELSKQLTGQYEDLYVSPNILVSLVTTGGGLEELQRALSSAGGRTTRVAPDGTIMVPFVGPVQAENLALVELEEEINERFRRVAPGFGVMVRLAGRP
jgi:polysaccharide export outer membrane protein